MDDIKCPKCGDSKYYIVLDKRNVPELRCRECDTYIGKTNSATMYDYFMDIIDGLNQKPVEEVKPIEKRPICKYCTERWAILDGRMGIRPREMNDIKYCPMCGRELQPEDKQY